MPKTISNLTERLVEFREDRDWEQFHSLKNLLVSLSLETAEMLELTQWKADGVLEDDLNNPDIRARLEEEVADVFLYLLMICERAGIDLADAAARKIDLNEKKYPAEKVRGQAKKYSEL